MTDTTKMKFLPSIKIEKLFSFSVFILIFFYLIGVYFNLENETIFSILLLPLVGVSLIVLCYRKNWIDKFFSIGVFLWIFQRYVYTTFFPNAFNYGWVAHFDSGNRTFALFLTLIGILAWFLGGKAYKIFVNTNIDHNPDFRNLSNGERMLAYYSWCLIVSVIIHIYFTLQANMNVAGVKSRIPFQSLIIYFLPVTFLIYPVTIYLIGAKSSRKTKILASTSLLGFVLLEALQGWKGGILIITQHLIIAYLVLRSWRRLNLRIIMALLLVVIIYIIFIAPFIESIRYAWIHTTSPWNQMMYFSSMKAKSFSKFNLSSRVNVLDPLIVAIEKKPAVETSLGLGFHLRGFILNLVPFTKEEEGMGFSRLFSIIYMGQDKETQNEYGSGTLASGYITGGVLGVIGFLFFMSFVLRGYRYIIRVFQSSNNFSILFDIVVYHAALGALTSSSPIVDISDFIKMVIILKAYSIVPELFAKKSFVVSQSGTYSGRAWVFQNVKFHEEKD